VYEVVRCECIGEDCERKGVRKPGGGEINEFGKL
jgi:hypothetical protein